MVTLVKAVQTSPGCPSQWDAWDAEGNYYYLRFRHGYGSAMRYASRDWPETHERGTPVASFEDADEWAGDIALDAFLDRAGLKLADDAQVVPYGQYLAGQLLSALAADVEVSDG